MSEMMTNSKKRKQLLKQMITQLHKGIAPEQVRSQLVEMLGEIPYDEVVEVEQELIAEGLPSEEVVKLCDIHSQALKGVVSPRPQSRLPVGHPVHTFVQENRAVQLEISGLEQCRDEIDSRPGADNLLQMQAHLNNLFDVDKHYKRKENLLFPYLEKLGITGPPTVMWGVHDEIRGQLKAAREALSTAQGATIDELKSVFSLVLQPLLAALEEMVYKEEHILFPMCLDRLDEADWYEIYRQTAEIGYCLYEPEASWKPEHAPEKIPDTGEGERVRTPSGSFTAAELIAILNTLPVDITFVDREDKVKYFSQGRDRIFHRMLSVLNRDVRMCHPPGSVGIVERILEDFKSGRQSRAPFWIDMKGRFIHLSLIHI